MSVRIPTDQNIISAGSFLERVGTDHERRHDRRFCYELAQWGLRTRWRIAEEAEDYATLAHLSRQWTALESL
jgi:hypothetical protein